MDKQPTPAEPLQKFEEVRDDVIDAVKPRLRGWLHVGVVPLSVVGGGFLLSLARAPGARWSAAVFASASVLMFATSALYHRGEWSPRARSVWRSLDHANIYWVIAGSYTPFAVLGLEQPASTIILSVVWGAAILGVVLRLSWPDGPRWFYTVLYAVVGWAAVFVLPQLVRTLGAPVVALVVVGGLLYTTGAVVYARRSPNPSPRWFGFHEVFHACTVAAWISHYLAVVLVIRQGA